MEAEFNPLQSRLLFAPPQRLHILSAWNEHVPFAMMLMELHRPRAFVELGAHWGISYCAFCQAAVAAGTGTQCYAVDTWAGDADAGYYGQEVYDDLKAHHRQYESFSTLLRMTFDEALGRVPDGTVDLLHIDGLHTYDAVKRDYETWRPKLSNRAIVLFHDTAVLDRGFGVHQLWSELGRQFPHFNFEHGFGLGVLAVGGNQSPVVRAFLQTASEQPAAVRRLFSALGHRLQCEVEKQHAAQNRSLLRRAVDRFGL